MARKRLGPERQQWKGIDANERAFGTVNNALVGIIVSGVAGVSPDLPGESWRMVSPEKADQYIERGRRVLADFESQEMAPGGARGRAQKWMDRHIDSLRKLVTDAEAVRAGKKPQKQTPESYAELRKYLGVGESRRYPQPKLPPRQFVAPRVHDFNTLDDLVKHARQEGATHVVSLLVRGTGQGEVKLYFPSGGQYEEARVRREGGYWHAEGPGARRKVARLPDNAVPIGEYGSPRRSFGWTSGAKAVFADSAPPVGYFPPGHPKATPGFQEAQPYRGGRREVIPGSEREIDDCRDAKAMVSYLPYLDTPYAATRGYSSGSIELCFATVEDARTFFNRTTASGGVERAELYESDKRYPFGRKLIDEFRDTQSGSEVDEARRGAHSPHRSPGRAPTTRRTRRPR